MVEGDLMNLPDYCPEGQRIQAVRQATKWVMNISPKFERQAARARHRYHEACRDWAEHEQKCKQCGGHDVG